MARKNKAKYKDTLFRAIFGREENRRWTLELYNALNKSNHTNISDLKITTLEDVIYINMKNDLSLMIDDKMTVIEQQSTLNPNMPLRGLLYFAELYEREYHSKMLYSTRLIKIATPQYFVLYNGTQNAPATMKMKLSDAFLIPSDGSFEWSTTFININGNKNSNLLDRCRPLKEYCEYVSLVRENKENGLNEKDAIKLALDYAIEQNFLDGFFLKRRGEIMAMGMTEFNEKDFKNTVYNDGLEDGIEKGLIQGRTEGLAQGKAEGAHKKAVDAAKILLANNVDIQLIIKSTGLSAEEIKNLK